MTYRITTTTTEGETHVFSTDSLEAVDQFVGGIQYRDISRIVAISHAPLTLVYGSSIQSVTIEGVTPEDVRTYEAKRREQAEKQMANQAVGAITGFGMAGYAALSNLVR